MATNFKIVHINQTITSKLLRKNIRVHMKCFKSKIIKKFYTTYARGGVRTLPSSFYNTERRIY